MKAIQLEKPQSFRQIDIAEPKAPGPGEALLKVHKVAVCGSDIGGFLGKMPFFSYPRIPGHELGVSVLAVGPGVTSVKVDASRTFGSETVVSTSDYVVQTDRGVIQSVAGPFLSSKRDGLVNSDISIWTRGPRVVQVVYTTATSSVPNDVKEAYARLVGHWYRKVKTEVASSFVNVSQQKFGETFQIFSNGGPEFPEDVVRLLAPYRVPLM